MLLILFNQAGTGTPPAAPSGLTAVGVGQTIVLNWVDNSSNEDGFHIERSTDGISYTQIATVGAGVISYTNTTFQGSTLYFYRVRAFNGAGNSAYSNVASLTSPARGAGFRGAGRRRAVIRQILFQLEREQRLRSLIQSQTIQKISETVILQDQLMELEQAYHQKKLVESAVYTALLSEL